MSAWLQEWLQNSGFEEHAQLYADEFTKHKCANQKAFLILTDASARRLAVTVNMNEWEVERFMVGLQELKSTVGTASSSGNDTTRYENGQMLSSSSCGQHTILQAVDRQTDKKVVLKKSSVSKQLAHQVFRLLRSCMSVLHTFTIAAPITSTADLQCRCTFILISPLPLYAYTMQREVQALRYLSGSSFVIQLEDVYTDRSIDGSSAVLQIRNVIVTSLSGKNMKKVQLTAWHLLYTSW
jgi:hypothetical protein